jgi:hypothetical protein
MAVTNRLTQLQIDGVFSAVANGGQTVFLGCGVVAIAPIATIRIIGNWMQTNCN